VKEQKSKMNKKMKTLLLLIKEPESSHSLIKYAMLFAEDLQTNLHLMYVENPANYSLGTPDLSGAAVAQIQHSIEAKLKTGKQELSGQVSRLRSTVSADVDVKITAVSGNDNQILSERIESGEAQMVMIEGSFRSGVLVSDIAAKDLVRDLRCPVWIVPQNSEYHSFHEIIYASDYHKEDIPTIRRLISLTDQLAPHITALHITDNVDFEQKIKTAGFQDMVEKKTEYNNIDVEVLAENGGEEMSELLNRYAVHNNTDLMVVLKENRRFLERIFKPSSSEKIIKETKLPVLVFHAN
jgi:nucleotide-binding universal stress UspA family protein